jgi:hypothetical protein
MYVVEVRGGVCNNQERTDGCELDITEGDDVEMDEEYAILRSREKEKGERLKPTGECFSYSAEKQRSIPLNLQEPFSNRPISSLRFRVDPRLQQAGSLC